MKKLTLLLLCFLFISCFTEPKKAESISIEKVKVIPPEQEKTVPAQKEDKPLNLEILIALLNKDLSQLKDWAKDNSYSIIDDGFYKHLSVENSSTSIIFDIYESSTCSSINIYRINEDDFKLLLTEARNIFPDTDCKNQNDSYMKMMEDMGESFYCYSDGKVKVTFDDKSTVDKKFQTKKENYFSLNMENVNQ